MITTDLVPRPAADLDTAPQPNSILALPDKLIAAVGDLLGEDGNGFFAAMVSAFEIIDWREREIAAAQARHPEQTDRIWHSFCLLDPNQGLERMSYENVYRAHCREILDRVAAGEDTRPGTAAEICCAMLASNLLAPLTSAATGLCMRMYLAADFPQFDELAEAQPPPRSAGALPHRRPRAGNAPQVDGGRPPLGRYRLQRPPPRQGSQVCLRPDRPVRHRGLTQHGVIGQGLSICAKPIRPRPGPRR